MTTECRLERKPATTEAEAAQQQVEAIDLPCSGSVTQAVEESHHLYEFWIRILDASITVQPWMSPFVKAQLRKAKTLWESADDSDEGRERYNESCFIVEQFLDFRFDTTRLADHSLFPKPQRNGASGKLVIHDMSFSRGLIPKIKKAVAEVYLEVTPKLSHAAQLVTWQKVVGSLVPGIVLRFKNSAAPPHYGYAISPYNPFFHEPEGTEFVIKAGAVEFEPDCQPGD